jgi:hypothetical protein
MISLRFHRIDLVDNANLNIKTLLWNVKAEGTAFFRHALHNDGSTRASIAILQKVNPKPTDVFCRSFAAGPGRIRPFIQFSSL